ncbi:hypothetical protein AUC71_06545 [Methyloceanibacter marginalis]|uniref:FAD-binding PCMH-type domain-containing protein n=1 Tax=Methyloceanibacter marginalis TaxID=1774971 RepID=A0A1E3WEP0_9HYPH|nr:FAD-binding protein [Methyloceanibacter marginalis]ODS03982.1 hypothetical protein AUC71_06545 [Methyloceanibacter marginalis]
MTGSMRLGFHAPETEEELAALVFEAAETRTPLEIMGKGTKRELGHPVGAGAVVSSEGMSGISLYEPTELVMVAKAGTPLAEIEAKLAENEQELPFEPVDLAPILGYAPGDGTIGGVIATNISGSRRILKGAARDHVLGIRAVNGRGEVIKAGGRVMKNVTGYDIGRTLAGSWGTLAMMTEISLKVLPAQRETRTILCFGLTDQTAVEALCIAMGTPYEVSGALHIHADLAARLSDEEIAGARIRSPRSGSRISRPRRAIGPTACARRCSPIARRWNSTANAAKRSGTTSARRCSRTSPIPLWRVSTAPTQAAKLVGNLSRKIDARVVYDWSGGLIWIETPPLTDAGAVDIRRQLAELGGHATLIRADDATRAGIDVFQPLEPQHAILSAKLKHAFDPLGIFNPGRMYRDM